MTIEQTKVIDFIFEKDSENIILSISDHLEWDQDNEHLFLLQEKLNSYLMFIESGEIYENYDSAKGKNISIHLHYKFEPTSSIMDFLLLAKESIEGADYSLTWSKLEN